MIVPDNGPIQSGVGSSIEDLWERLVRGETGLVALEPLQYPVFVKA